MDITNYREEIDRIDKELVALIDERMRVAEKIAMWKVENGKRIVDPIREHALLEKISEMSSDDLVYYNRMMFTMLMEMSVDHQHMFTAHESPVVGEIQNALENTPNLFPSSAIVACQGVQGAYSQEACERFFKNPKTIFMKNFKGVFSAVESGLAKYGVLPIENSTAGSVNQVYDLMKEHDFHIVRSLKIKVNHCLLINPGTQKADITEIFSHEQALAQCDEYIRREYPDAKVTVCENTAGACKMLAESGRTDAAAIGSKVNGSLYALDCLDESIQDNDNNYTRFICITKELEIYPGANKTSFMCVTKHTPGALYRVLSKFNASNINVVKLESRPIPSSDFDFGFYFDFVESVYSPEFIRAMAQIEAECKEFKYFGSYVEL